MPATYALPLTTAGTVAATATTPGTNVLTWDVPPTTGAGNPQTDFLWRALFLQRSINVDAPGPFGANVFNHVTTLSSGNHRLVPGINARWSTIKSWATAELPAGNWPLTYSDPAPHTTFYYYRLIYMARANADGTGTGIQYTWNYAKIVQPGVLNYKGTAGANCSHTLCWDAPDLYDDHFNFFVGPSSNPQYKWEIRWSWPLAAQPTKYSLYKSVDGGANYVGATDNIPASFPQPFLDADTRYPIFYKLTATTSDGFVSVYDIKRTP